MTDDTKSPEQVEQEIRQTRSGIEDTIDALQRKLSPGQLLDEALSHFSSGGNGNGSDILQRFGAGVSSNPVPLALIGAGIAWMAVGSRTNPAPPQRNEAIYARPGGAALGTGRTTTGDGTSSAGGAVKDKAGIIKEKAGALKDNAGAIKDRAAETAHAARESGGNLMAKTGEGIGAAKSRAQDLALSAQDRGRRATRSVADFAVANPLAAGAVALAAGAVLAAALPTTRREDELLGEHADAVKGAVGKSAADRLGQASGAIRKAAESIEDSDVGDPNMRKEGARIAGAGADAVEAAAKKMPGADAASKPKAGAKQSAKPGVGGSTSTA